MAVDIDDKKLDGKGLSDLWGIIKQYVAQHGSGVVPATEDTLGGIMVGSTLSITNAGVLNLPTLVTASTFRSVSVDAYGRVVGGTNPTTIAGYGITDAKIENGVITLGGNTITPITSLSGYATQSWVQQQGYTTNIGTVTQVKIGSTAYNPSSGVVSLPAYETGAQKHIAPTSAEVKSALGTGSGTSKYLREDGTWQTPPDNNTWRPLGTGANDACAGNDSRLSNARPASDVYSWAKASTKPSYTLDEVGDGSSRKLSNYLPLSGGGIVNGLLQVNVAKNYDTSIIRDASSFSVGQHNGDSIWFGCYPSNYGWIQSSYYGTSSITSSTHTYPLILQPIGGNVGIGTNAPSYKLDISGTLNATTIYQNGVALGARAFDSTNYLPLTGGTVTGVVKINAISIGVADDQINSDKGLHLQYNNNRMVSICAASTGNVGIGTTDPSYKLHVNGDAGVSNLYISGSIYTTNASPRKIYGWDYGSNEYDRLMSFAMLPDNDYNDAWQVRPWNGDRDSAYITVLHGGNVGIGTTNPTDKLYVNGSAHIHDFLTVYTGDTHDLTDNMQTSASVCIGEYNDDAIWIGRVKSGSVGFIQCSYHDASASYNLSLQPRGGNVGIGTTDPSYKLHVAGSLYASTYYNLPFSVQRGTMNHIKTSSNNHIYYLPMSGSDARKCIFSYIMEYYYQYSSGNYSYHAGNGFADTMGVKYVYSITYDGQTVTNSWVVTTGGHDAGNMYYSYIIIN